MIQRLLHGLACYLLLVPSIQAAEVAPFSDDFSNLELSQRRALRGAWHFRDGTASCTQDDALFKKHKDHGPILFYDLKHRDATVRFHFQAEAVKTVVFTMNGEGGHIFRFVLANQVMSVRAFPTEGHGQSIAVAAEKMPLPSKVWIPVEIQLRGSKATVTIGDTPPRSFDHPSFEREKVNLSLGFSYGTLRIRSFTVQP